MLLNSSSMIYILQISISAQVHINSKSQLPARFATKTLCVVAAPCQHPGPDRDVQGQPRAGCGAANSHCPCANTLCMPSLACQILGEEQ